MYKPPRIYWLIFVLLILVVVNPAWAQKNPKVAKAIEVFNNGKIGKGIAMMESALKKDQTDQHWDILVNMYAQRYDFAQIKLEDQLAAAQKKDPDAVLSEDAYAPLDRAFMDLVKVSREAGLNSQSGVASETLRTLFIEENPDTNLSEETLTAFYKAESFYAEEEFKKAKKHYKEALALESKAYNATLYLADSFWYLKELDSAIFYFKQCADQYPAHLDPQKFLVEVLLEKGREDEAEATCLQALLQYPDPGLILSLETLVEKRRKRFNLHWIPRGCEINQVDGNQARGTESVWSHYHAAKREILPYCDESGIITQKNDLTKTKYMEIYSWEKMLKEAKKLPKELVFAKKMQNDGYLDCYVFLSLFHFDLYPQYEHFSAHHADRIKTFIDKYLTR